MRLRRALVPMVVAGVVAGALSGCLRAVSTPDAWPCLSSADCESNEVCLPVAAAGAPAARGECRSIEETGAQAGQGGGPSPAETGAAGAAGEAPGGSGGAEP